MIYFVTNQTDIGEYNDILPATVQDVLSYFKDKAVIQYDSETLNDGSYPGKLALMQFGADGNEYVIDCLTVDPILFKDLLEDSSKVFLAHNFKFDYQYLYKHGIVPFENIRDTFLAERHLSTGLIGHKLSLAACLYRHFKITISKQERGLIHKLGIYHSRILRYSATDVKHLQQLDDLQQRKLKETEMINCNKLDNLFVGFLAYAEYCGVKIDADRWLIKAKADEEKLYEIEKRLNRAVVELDNPKYLKQPDLFNRNPSANVNWNSPKQVIDLMKKLGCNLLTIDKKTKKEKESVAADVLEPQKHLHPIIELYLEYTNQETFVSRYGRKFLRHIHPATERVHTNYTQIKNTGRLASGKDKEGEQKIGDVNLQNIPQLPDRREPDKLYERDLFVPGAGCEFVVADFSAQEARIMAELSGDMLYLEYVLNRDIHAFCARLLDPTLEHLSDKEIKANHSSTRTRAKSITFSIQYGGNGATIASNLGISRKEGERIYEAFMRKFPGLKAYFDRVKAEAVDKGYILINGITGRRRFFPQMDQFYSIKTRLEAKVNKTPGKGDFKGLSSEFWNYYRTEKGMESSEFDEMRVLVSKYFGILSSMEKEALNTPVQGTASEMFKLACIYVYREILKRGHWGTVKAVLLIHDELVLEAPTHLSEMYGEILSDCMQRAGAFFCKRVKIPAAHHVGQTWEH